MSGTAWLRCVYDVRDGGRLRTDVGLDCEAETQEVNREVDGSGD